MVNYNSGKIYKIEPICEHEENEIYIGSTTKTLLSQRMSTHRGHYKQWKKGEKTGLTRSFLLFEKYGLDNCKILLIENVENCNSKDDLYARESHYIKTLKCINISIPNRTHKEWTADNAEYCLLYSKNYRENNKELMREKDKQQYEKKKTKESYKEQKRVYIKQYYETNKEQLQQYGKNNYEKNKEKLLRKITCICGSIHAYTSKSTHLKTIKHQTFLQNNPECIEL